MAFVDGSVVNVALPSIQGDLGGGLATQQWVVDAYLLTLGSLILVGGSLGDIFGESRVFAIGVASFAGASLLCAIAPNAPALIVFRGLQGMAGALLVPASLATVWTGFLLLTTRKKAIMQVLGYLLLENGIYLFGLLLLKAMPELVEVGVLLDLFTGVFVMGIIIHHISREFASISTEHLTSLRDEG